MKTPRAAAGPGCPEPPGSPHPAPRSPAPAGPFRWFPSPNGYLRPSRGRPGSTSRFLPYFGIFRRFFAEPPPLGEGPGWGGPGPAGRRNLNLPEVGRRGPGAGGAEPQPPLPPPVPRGPAAAADPPAPPALPPRERDPSAGGARGAAADPGDGAPGENSAGVGGGVEGHDDSQGNPRGRPAPFTGANGGLERDQTTTDGGDRLSPTGRGLRAHRGRGSRLKLGPRHPGPGPRRLPVLTWGCSGSSRQRTGPR